MDGSEFLGRIGGHKLVIGMIHLQPLPGTPFHVEGTLGRIRDTAVASARTLQEAGADGCLVQTADRVYQVEDDADPARITTMALIVDSIRRECPGFAVGVQIMQNAVRASLAVAHVAGGTFVRASALVGMTLTQHGLVQANPLCVMAYRRSIAAQKTAIIADVHSTGFQWFGAERSPAEVARMARNAGADGLALGHKDPTKAIELIEAVRRVVPDRPLLLSGHTSHDNARELLRVADGAFVGGCLEPTGWGEGVDRDLASSYVEIARSL